jgi:hypothetical protein
MGRTPIAKCDVAFNNSPSKSPVHTRLEGDNRWLTTVVFAPYSGVSPIDII